VTKAKIGMNKTVSETSNPNKLVVNHVGVWLARTKTWIYSQVTQLGPDWQSWVVADRTENLSEFPHDKIFSVFDHHSRPLWLVETVLCGLGLTRQRLSIRRFVRALKPDIVHSHFGPVGWRDAAFVRTLDAKHVVSFYGYDVTRLPTSKVWQKRYAELFDDVDIVLCEGPHMAAAIHHLGCREEKIKVYHLGVNLEAIPFTPPSWRTGKPLRVFMAARFEEKKGFPYALEAIGVLKKTRPDLKIDVTIVGGAGETEESQKQLAAIDRMIKRYDLSDVVCTKGFCSHTEFLQMAASHDLFLSPSVVASSGDTEGGAPVSIIEMAAAGLVIVSTKHCDIPYVLGEKNRQILCEEKDVDALVEELIWLLDHSEVWPEMARENRLRVEEHFNLRRQGPALAKIYGEITSS